MTTRDIRQNIGLALLIVLLAAGRTTVPMTERRGLSLVPDAELAQMAQDSYREILSASVLSDDPRQLRLVRTVGRRLADATEEYLREKQIPTEEYNWEFNVIEDDDRVNAWCMPGGKIAVYTGILPVTRDEDGLAVVLGHEIAHAVAKHANERISQALLLQSGGQALSTALPEKRERTRELFSASYGALCLLPYSRLHEFEADRIGLTIMAMAGYRTAVAVAFWRRMSEAARGKVTRVMRFVSTHPLPETRISNIEKLLPEAQQAFRPP